jgi:hypothetical protein
MVRQNNQDLQDKLLESETKVANLTAKLGTATKCIEEQDKTIVLRDAKIKSLISEMNYTVFLLHRKLLELVNAPKTIIWKKSAVT